MFFYKYCRSEIPPPPSVAEQITNLVVRTPMDGRCANQQQVLFTKLVLYRCTRKYIGRGVHGCTFFIRDGSHRLCELSVPPRRAAVPRNSDVLVGGGYQNSRPRIDKDVNSWTQPAVSQDRCSESPGCSRPDTHERRNARHPPSCRRARHGAPLKQRLYSPPATDSAKYRTSPSDSVKVFL